MRDLQVKRIEACLCYFNCVFLTHFRCSEHFFFVFYFFTRFSRFQSSMIFTFILRYSIYFITLSLVCKNLCRWNLCKEEEYPRYSMSVFFFICVLFLKKLRRMKKMWAELNEWECWWCVAFWHFGTKNILLVTNLAFFLHFTHRVEQLNPMILRLRFERKFDVVVVFFFIFS